MVKIDIISGFLGAGKTTLINKLLTEGYTDERLVVIENEFGEVNIDSELIDNPEICVKEITSGCICCSLQGDFVRGIKEVVLQYNPERILIEPTGAGDLESIIDACKMAAQSAPVRINAIITVVSAESIIPLLEIGGDFFKKQIEASRIIVLSCTQLISDEELSNVIERIRQHNPNCLLFSKPWETLSSLLIIAAAEEAVSQHGHEYCRHEHACSHEHDHPSGPIKGGFASYAFYPKKAFTKDEINNMLTAFASSKCGRVFRAKGFLNCNDKMIKAEYVYGRGEWSSTSYRGEQKFVVIGTEINEAEINKFF